MPGPGLPDPAFAPHDLDERTILAYEEGHDADIPSNIGFIPEKHSSSTENVHEITDLEKGPHSSSSSITAADAPASPPDPNIVWWDSDQDPANPMNWSMKLKWGNIAVLSIITLITPLASSMFAPGVPQVMEDFKSSNQQLATFVVSVYILGFAFGPLVIAPLSELYGRLRIYHGCNLLFVIFTVACAVSSNLNMLIGFRLLAGCVGVAPLTIGGGTIADVMPQEKRGGAMSIWVLGPLLGPVLGPVAGGYLCQAKGWRWVFYLLAIMAGAVSIAAVFLMRETHAPTILARKTARLRKETGNQDLRSKLDNGMLPKTLFLHSIVRPTKMLLFSPIVAALSVYMAVVYGILYLLFTTFTFVFEDTYHFSSGNVGLTYVASGVGMLLGLGILGAVSDRIMKAKSKNGAMKPEYRLPPLVPGGLCIPVGLFMYGWSAQYHVHWIVPMIGTLFVGLGLIAVFMGIQTYLVDAFTVHAASAMAANTVLRSILGALLPLGGLRMYAVLGLGWGNSLVGFVALALVPIPFLLLKYGESIRTNPRFQVKL